MGRPLGDIGYPVDVIVMATERFEETKGVIGGVAYPAHKYGVCSMKPPEEVRRELGQWTPITSIMPADCRIPDISPR